MVTSVNDMVTEITMQFVAHDVFNIEKTEDASIEIKAEKEETKRTVSPKLLVKPRLDDNQQKVIGSTSTDVEETDNNKTENSKKLQPQRSEGY